MISSSEALLLLEQHLKNKNLVKHCQAVALIMKKLAEHFHEDSSEWYLCGLLHDIDYDLTYQQADQHGILAMDILKDTDIPEAVKHSIQAHSGNIPLESLLDKALWVADPLSGLIIACALMTEDKSIKSVKLSSLIKKYKTKNFAAGANRDQIAQCESLLDLPLNDFFELSLEGMKDLLI